MQNTSQNMQVNSKYLWGCGEAKWSDDDGMFAKGGMTTRKIGLNTEGKGDVNTWKVL